jgi:hypothetical protein
MRKLPVGNGIRVAVCVMTGVSTCTVPVKATVAEVLTIGDMVNVVSRVGETPIVGVALDVGNWVACMV